MPIERRQWKSVLKWISLAMTLLFPIVVIATIALLHSERFHAFLLRVAQQKATTALGTDVRLNNFSFGWKGTGAVVSLSGIRVNGAPPHANLTLLQADTLRVQVTVSSFLHRSWYVNELVIDHPVVRVVADQQGRTNLPNTNKSSTSGTGPNAFDLGVRHLAINRGEIYYNDLKSDLTADVRELSVLATFDPGQTRYAGSMSYKNGHVKWRDANPIAHDFEAHFAASPSEFTLQSATLATSRSRVVLSGTVTNYSRPSVTGKYYVLVDAGEFRTALHDSSLPSGKIQLSGDVGYQATPDRPLLASLVVKGVLQSSRLTVPYQQKSTNIDSIGGRYTLLNGNASIDGLHAQVLGGIVTASLITRDLAAATRSHLSMQLKGVSAAQVQKLLAPESTDRGTITGSLSMMAEGTWGKTLSDLIANTTIIVQAGLKPAHGEAETPLNGLVRARYAGSTQTVSFEPSYLKTPQTSITVNGTVSQNSSLNIRADSRELGELDALLASLRGENTQPLNLHGQGSLTASVKGSMSAPQVTGELAASNLQARGTAWKAVRTEFFASPNAARLEQGQIVPVSGGRIDFQLSTALQKWSFTQSNNFQVRLKAASLKATDLAKAAGLSVPVSGNLSADVEAHGTQLSPLGHGSIDLRAARLGIEPIRSADLSFQATGDTVIAKLHADVQAGSATANLNYRPREQAYTASLRATGIKLEQLETIKARNLQLTGVLNATSDGRGTLQNPGLTAQIEIPRLQIQNQVITGLKLNADIANHEARLNLGSQVLGVRTSGQGTVRLVGDYPAEFSFDTDAIPIQFLVALASPAQASNFTGQTQLRASLRGPLKNKNLLEAHVAVPNLTVNYKNTVQLAAAGPIRADYIHGVLDVARSQIRGTGTELTFQAHVPAAKEAPASLLMQGKIDLQLAQVLDPDVTSQGELRFDIDSFGARSDPDVQGQIRIVNANIAQAGVPLGLRDGNGVLTLTRNRLDITQFQGKVGGGDVTARGGIIYRPDLRFDLGMKAQNVRLLYQQAIRTTINSNLALSGQYDNALLQGQVDVDQISFTSNFDLMDFAGQFGGGEATPPPTEGMAQNMQLQIAIRTPGGVNLSSRTLTVAGSANLQVRGSAAQPVLLGRVNLSDGDLIFSGNRYVVQGGTIDFRNPSRTEPTLDLSASTTIQQYDIQMHFWGPADHLHTNYSSDPALPPADVINLIAFGKTSEAAAANPTPPGSLGAESLLASQVSNQVTSRVEKLAGISQLSIDPVFGSSQQSPGARIALQQRVTSKIYVTFATDVTSTQQQAVKMEYKVNRRASFTFVRNQNGGLSFETSFTKGW